MRDQAPTPPLRIVTAEFPGQDGAAGAPRMLDALVTFARAHRHAGIDYPAGACVGVSLAAADKLRRLGVLAEGAAE